MFSLADFLYNFITAYGFQNLCDQSRLLTCVTRAFRRAASHKEKLAEVYELEIGDQKKAIESYELAASW